MSELIKERVCAEVEADVAVFLIGNAHQQAVEVLEMASFTYP